MNLSIRWKLILSIVIPLLLITLVVMWLTLDKIYAYSQQRQHEYAMQQAKHYADSLDAQFKNIAQIADTTAAFLEAAPKQDVEVLYRLLRSNVSQNPLIYGASIAYAPYQYSEQFRLFAPYVYRGSESIMEIDIGRDAYDYTLDTWQWYSRVRDEGKPSWTKPYFDEGAGNILMNTYAVPFYQNGEFKGVTTVDVALENLPKSLKLELPDEQPFIIVDPDGHFISHPDSSFILNRTIHDRSREEDNNALAAFPQYLLSGETCVFRVENSKVFPTEDAYWIFYSTIQSTAWAFATALPEHEILAFVNAQIQRGVLGVILIVCLITVCILIVSTTLTKPITSLSHAVKRLGEGDLNTSFEGTKTKDEIGELADGFNAMVTQLKRHVYALTQEATQRESVESELRFASEIQASLLPSTFPAFPNQAYFDLHAVNEAARHVGGDFFDFFLIDSGKLVLSIADVSGKGVASAIFMAVTRTIIRNQARALKSPAEILSETNKLLIETHNQSLFVTIFIMIYDIKTGEFVYANAGHPSPLLVTEKGQVACLGKPTGTIVGMLDDADYEEEKKQLYPDESLILYTDGVTEARSPDGLFYGEDNFKNILQTYYKNPMSEICSYIINELVGYQGNHLKDDITLMALRRLG